MIKTEYTEQMANFLVSNCNVNQKKAEAVTAELWELVKTSTALNPTQAIFNCLDRNGIIFETNKINDFLPVLMKFVNNVPHDSNGGLSPCEMKKTSDHSICLNKMDAADLPEELVLPTPEQIKKEEAVFTKYTDTTPWHEGGDAKIAKLKKGFIKYHSVFEKMPNWNDLLGGFLDQYLASLYNSDWSFTVFTPEAKLAEDVYLCLDNENYEFVLKSHSVTLGLQNGYHYYLSLLSCLGSFYETWGTVLQYKSTGFEDFEFLAKKVAPSLYKNSGFSEVVKFDPVTFWASGISLAEVPSMEHGDKKLLFCEQKGYFKDNTIPEFSSRWKHEVSGKKHRWIYRANGDFFNRLYVYYHEKTGAVYLETSNYESFEELSKKAKNFFVAKEDEYICSMPMADFILNTVKKDVPMLILERDFINE